MWSYWPGNKLQQERSSRNPSFECNNAIIAALRHTPQVDFANLDANGVLVEFDLAKTVSVCPR